MINHPYIAKLLVEARIDELRRDARAASPPVPADLDTPRPVEETGVPVKRRRFPRRRPVPVPAPASDPCS